MNRTNRILPTYTGDVSGACSALFELGGMVVIHDPSGCNSTYNTHDETRWYDTDSLIFITGLTERDAVLGNDRKLVEDVVVSARQLSPRFIALCNSPIPFIAGTDFAALARLIERDCGIPCFYVPTNGMHDYTVGAGGAFAALARSLMGPGANTGQREACRLGDPERTSQKEQASPQGPRVNILGVTPLDFDAPSSADSLRSFMEDAGFSVTSCWAMGSSLDELSRAAEADINLVVSSTGLATAELLRKRFGTPYVVGAPIGSLAPVVADALHEAMHTGACAWPARDARGVTRETQPPPHTVPSHVVIGDAVVAGSIAAAYGRDTGMAARVVCPLETHVGLLGKGDRAVFGEEEVEAALVGAEVVVADGLYAPVICPGARHIVLHHHAFSGRVGMTGAQDLTKLAF